MLEHAEPPIDQPPGRDTLEEIRAHSNSSLGSTDAANAGLTDLAATNADATPIDASSIMDDLSNDDSWAKPKKRTNRRLTFTAGFLALTLFGLGTFIAGAKLADGSGSSSGGAAARRNGAFTGLGGGGATGFPGGGTGFPGGAGGFPAGVGGGRRSGSTGSTSSGATSAGAAALNDLINGSSSAPSGPAIQGRVTAVDATSITVTRSDGSTAVITIDNKATFARRTNVSVSEIKVGDEVAAEGTADTAGNVAATAVTVGDLPAATATTDATATPETGSDLGGLLGG